ncbi:isocitrate lyase/phosphoenolpyruvate mutase family protein [Actinoplanes sp. TFC3]|uniref:isocitrate lyase/PEP mutase family protein n=1 Tax=Actinoplanes sp. TFC3 TaxID=1710355 RepID=UPI0008332EB5|nr:isocitrate lyase/phosphoenolpyruvate mutase family protein [Actinoplanes sp. TFC3]
MADFFALHRAGDPLVLPNAWDVASAAILVSAGFAAVGTTSLGVAAAHGLPDAQGLGRAETIALVRRLAPLPVLLTVDIEGGFGGDPDDVADLCAELAEAGAAGVNIEDGRADGSMVPVAAHAELISAVKAQVPGLFVNARTDTHWLADGEPPPLHVTLSRLETYVAAGADGVFVPGLNGADRIRTVAREIEAPLNVLLLPGMTVPRLADLGVARVSTGSLLFRAALDAAVTLARAVVRGEPAPGGLPGYHQINGLAPDGD